MSNTTVALPVVDSTVVEAYRAADQKGKARIRGEVTAAMHSAIEALDVIEARNHKATLEALTTARPTPAPVNYNAVLAARIVTLRHAAALLEEGSVLPEGIDAATVDTDTVLAMVADMTVDGDLDAAAMKLAGTKLTRTTERRSIQQVVDNAFADLSEGDFLTVAQIRTLGSWEGYVPSDGAIAARLFPANGNESTLEGVTATEATATTPRGATKA